MGIEIRAISDGELDDLLRLCAMTFGEHATDEELVDERDLSEPGRMLGAVDDGRFVASAGAMSFELTLPGGSPIPAAGISWVGVLPTHRRRGVLTDMMRFQLDDVAERREPLAILLASESAIYGRFGYGVATRVAKVSVDTTRGLPLLVEPAAGGSLRLLPRDEHATACAPVYDRVRRERVGEISRPAVWWTVMQRDREKWRDDASARFCVVHESNAGEIDGYCWYRVKELKGSEDAVARNEVRIWDLAAASAEVEAALLAYLADIDLTTSITTWARPVDDPWPFRLADQRRYRVNLVSDLLYVRLLDVPAALAARRYEAPGTMSIDVDDPFRPAVSGRYHLEVDEAGEAVCERSTASSPADADLRLDVATLGSLYLGDVAPSTLAAAGRLHAASDAALSRADRIFPTARKPFCTTEF